MRSSPSLRLVAYSDCGQLLNGLRKAAAARTGPYGLSGDPIMRPLATGRVPGGPSDAQAAPHSDTNVEEPGVGEPDLIKTDGRRIVTESGGWLRVIDAASHEQTGALDLSSGGFFSPGEVLLSGDRVLVVQRPMITFTRRGVADIAPNATEETWLTLVDIKGAPRVVSSMRVKGTYVDTRQTGSVARVVIKSAPHIVFPQRRGGTDATTANRAAVRAAPLDAWLPRYSVTRSGRTTDATIPCERISHPPSYTGTSLVSVLSVDLAGDMADASPVSVVAGGETVYGSAGALYVTDRPTTDGRSVDRTDIYRFDIGRSGPPRFAASGSVAGVPVNHYALSEYAGKLRIATTSGGQPMGSVTPAPTDTAVYVLAQHGMRLERIGGVHGLGRGERVYAVRFVGPNGYVVTFRQTDPLYTLDLRDPAKPRTTGELKISGYSAYLHPAGDGRLIGVGRQTDSRGRPQGTQVSLFDVRDPAHPRKQSGYTVRSGWSAVEDDPHAFLYWPQDGLTVVPMGDPDGALVLRVTASGVHRLGSVRPKESAGPVQRTVLVGGTLWSLTPAGLEANDVTSLAKTAWVPFA